MKIATAATHPGYYNSEGKRIPSVTTIAKLIDRPDGLIAWAWKCGMEGKDYKQVRDDAASIGHLVHSLIDNRILGREVELPPDLDPEAKEKIERSFRAFESWINGNKFALLESEVKLISERHQFAGRLDCIGSVNEEMCIVDWKTTSGVWPSYLVQVSGYRGAWNETHRNSQIHSCHLLRVKKDDGGFVHHYFPRETLDKAWGTFLGCRELYEQQKELAKLI